MKNRSIVILIILLPLVSCLFTACDEPEEKLMKHEQIKGKVPVKLPSVPHMPMLEITKKYQDGALSVTGTIRYKIEFMDKPMRVRGTVTKKYICPYRDTDAFLTSEELKKKYRKKKKPAPDPDTPLCKEPHLFINDAQEDSKTLLVIGYPILDEPKFEEGETYTFVGHYTTIAMGFANPEDGLILLEKIEEWPEEEEIDKN